MSQNVSIAPKAVYDSLTNVEELVDVAAVEFVAYQLLNIAVPGPNNTTITNGNQNILNGAYKPQDLTNQIADITISTACQGSGVLEVMIIDPYWTLLTRFSDQQGNVHPAFFDVDQTGLLMPVDVNFPEGTNSWWRLAALSPSTPDGSPNTPNIRATFEDRIVSDLRDIAEPANGNGFVSHINELRANFIGRVVGYDSSSLIFVCPALQNPPASSQFPTTAAPTSASNANNHGAKAPKVKPQPAPAKATLEGDTFSIGAPPRCLSTTALILNPFSPL